MEDNNKIDKVLQIGENLEKTYEESQKPENFEQFEDGEKYIRMALDALIQIKEI